MTTNEIILALNLVVSIGLLCVCRKINKDIALLYQGVYLTLKELNKVK